MNASAAIPGAFPPVMIDVEVDGRRYQEMHVDGRAIAQVFVYPIGLDFEALAVEHDAQRARTLYVIRNSRLDADWAQVERRTLSIAARAISSLIHTQGVGDLYRIFLTARRDGLVSISRISRRPSTDPTPKILIPNTCGPSMRSDTPWPPAAIPERRRPRSTPHPITNGRRARVRSSGEP